MFKESLSARRAWIEINGEVRLEDLPTVALRKESVDRNSHNSQHTAVRVVRVALRKESVDRNGWETHGSAVELRRSPQGERG